MYFLGCSGWYYGDWEGLFYPEGMPKSKWLEFYATKFNTVEVNATFYRFPFPNMVKGWYDRTPKDFIFTLKGNRQITHVKKLNDVKDLVNSFYRTADLLKEKLGCILWQLPPSLKLNLERLEGFCSDLDKDYRNVIEFRHSSWYCDEVYKLLKRNKLGFCVVSAPKLPEEAKVTSGFAYIRFHGKEGWYNYNYSHEELKRWADKIKLLKAKDIYCYFNNDYNAYAVSNCEVLKRLSATPSPHCKASY